MKKIFIILILSNLLFSKSLAETFYFKECKLSEAVSADYVININKKVINVLLKTDAGETQEWIDPIKVIQENKIITKTRNKPVWIKDFYVIGIGLTTSGIIAGE